MHTVDVLAEDLSFYRGVMRGGYTANNQTCTFKTYTRHTQKSEKREKEREREIYIYNVEGEKQQQCKSCDIWVYRHFKKLNYTWNTSAKSQNVTCFPETQWIHYKMQWFQF